MPGLARTAMPAAIVGDAAVTLGSEKEHLRFPSVRAQRPAMAEGNDGAGAPVLVVNLGSVLGGDGAHRLGSIVWLLSAWRRRLAAALRTSWRRTRCSARRQSRRRDAPSD